MKKALIVVTNIAKYDNLEDLQVRGSQRLRTLRKISMTQVMMLIL